LPGGDVRPAVVDSSLAGYLSSFAGVLQHLNVRTPRWLGLVIQRSEAHAVHHARGVHGYNYGNFRLWDILFGTFRNPATFAPGPQGRRDARGRDAGEPRRPTLPVMARGSGETAE
jgi:sterol desaturase/sphingolipid hydroxylase (fatty acid hydroxylase superfamily)